MWIDILVSVQNQCQHSDQDKDTQFSVHEKNLRLKLERTTFKGKICIKVLWANSLIIWQTGPQHTIKNCIWSVVFFLNTRRLNRLSALWNGWRQARTRLPSLRALIKNPSRHSEQPSPVSLWIGAAMLTLSAKENRGKSLPWSHGLCQEGSAIIPMDRFTASLKSNVKGSEPLMYSWMAREVKGQPLAWSFSSKNTRVTNNTMIVGQIAQNRPFSSSLITHEVTLAANEMPFLPATTDRVWLGNN